jgi:hypothetical protein
MRTRPPRFDSHERSTSNRTPYNELAIEQMTAAANVSRNPRRIADDQMKIRNALRDDRSHTDHRETSYNEIVADRAICADRRAFPDERWKGLLIGVARAQPF